MAASALAAGAAQAAELPAGADSVSNFPETFSILVAVVLGCAGAVVAGVAIVRALRGRRL
jgi:hypothetical protein